MTRQVFWTEDVVKEFIKKGNLTPFEIKVLKTRAAGMERKEQAVHLHCSVSKVDKTIEVLRIKYDLAQKNSDILPEREKSLKELMQKYKRPL